MAERIGPYGVVRELGRGGMGVVYEVQGPGRDLPLALKLLLDSDADFLRRFEIESRVLQFVSRHPHVIDLLDLGQDGGRPYLVMRLARGGSLADRLKTGLDLATGLRCLRQVAQALEFAHEGGVVHRDVKPGNILFGAEGQALLSDFGLARDLRERSLTLSGTLLGTPSYMAPEQANGARVDRRTDVYALGVVLYQLLTGEVPFKGGSVQVLKQILIDPPRPPRELRHEVSPALEAVCLRALAKAPDERQQTAAAFARELEEATQPKTSARGRRVPLLPLGLASLACLGVGLGLGLGSLLGMSSPVDPPSTPVPAPDRVREAQRLDGAADPTAARRYMKLLEGTDGGPHERALWAERAADLDLETASQGSAAFDALRASARATLESKSPQPEAVHRARRRLNLARVLAPQADLRAEAALIPKVARRGSAEVRSAARPWATTLPELEPLLQSLADTPPYPLEVSQRAINYFAHERNLAQRGDSTWPEGWFELQTGAHDHRQVDHVTEEALLWHPELNFLWFELAFHRFQYTEPTPALTRIFEQAVEEDSSESWFWFARYLLRLGDAERAVAAGRRCMKSPTPKDVFTAVLIDALLLRGRPADLSEVEELFARPELRDMLPERRARIAAALSRGRGR